MNPALPKNSRLKEKSISRGRVNPALPKNSSSKNIRKSGVKITIKNLQKKISLRPKTIKKIVFNTLSLKNIKKTGEITICFVNDKKIKELNLKYLNRDNSTDVIAFDITEPQVSDNILADIVVSTDQAVVNAKIYKTTVLYELYLYVIHGVLHLLGYRDKNAIQKQKIEARTNRILSAMKMSINTP